MPTQLPDLAPTGTSNQPRAILANDYFGLQGRVALVTGASSGLGQHFAQVLAAAGCIVGIAARRVERLESLAQNIQEAGGQAVVLGMDVTDRASIELGVAALVKQAGAVSVLVNNAGAAVNQSFIDAEDADTDSIFTLNQTAVWQVGQILCKQMIANGVQGSVINIASIAGVRTLGGAASYSVSKAAVIQMTKVMAMELARHQIRVNAIAPGYISTEMNSEFLASPTGQKLVNRSPMRRVGEADELDGALLLLASERAAFMTGAVIPVDGGHLVSSL